MNLADFLNKYTGKLVDYDGYAGGQCVDIFRQYCKDVFEIPHTGAVEGAKDLWHRYYSLLEPKYFTRHTGAPRVGDVAIWEGTDTNKYGHVAIVIGQTEENILVFEQDGFKQDGAKFAARSTKGLLGYLRLK